jgi:16S rRNA processing protein RimM
MGEVRCVPTTDFPERFLDLALVVIETKSGRRPLAIKRARQGGRFVYLTFEGCGSRTDTELLIGGQIQIPESERIVLPPDHYYRYEIEGLSVYLEGGAYLGTVVSVLETGGNDVYLVKDDQREYLIPAIKSVVKQVDLIKREMTICPMEGMLDL